jgi:hypothetical protein
MPSAQNMQENSEYKSGDVCFSVHQSLSLRPSALFVRMHVSSQEFRWNLVWNLCHWRPQKNRSINFPTVSDSKVADARNCEVVVTVASLPKYGKHCNYTPVLAMETVLVVVI